MLPGMLKKIAAIFGALTVAGCATHPCCTGTASAASPWPWKIPPRTQFLAEIPPPPAPGSAVAKRDLVTVLALQSKATPAKIMQAERSYDLTIFTYAPALGSTFTPQSYPRTAKFFHELNDLVNSVNNNVKNTYQRPHPFQVSTKVKRFVIAKPGYSYPSYHSARCIVFQGALDQLDPGHQAAFNRISAQVEEDRVFAGEHFPSDIEAGKRLGRLIWSALEMDKNFHAAVTRLKKAEWTPPPSGH